MVSIRWPPFCALLASSAILKITNARSHFWPGEVTNDHEIWFTWLAISAISPPQRIGQDDYQPMRFRWI
jgi:hypothetical protein